VQFTSRLHPIDHQRPFIYPYAVTSLHHPRSVILTIYA